MGEMNRIKLLVATGLYPPEIGGPATYSKMLEEQIQAHAVDVVVVPFGAVRHLPKVFRHIVFAWHLFRQSKDVDIIYALDSISVGVPALLVSAITQKPFMIRLGGDYAWEQGQQRFGLTLNLDEYTKRRKESPFMVKVLATIQSFVVQRAFKVIAPSNYLKSIIETWGIESERIEVIYSALFPLRVTAAKPVIREQLLYSGMVITTVGRLVPWKGFSELIDVVNELKKEIPDITLVIIGDGPMYDELATKIATIGLEQRVRLVGRLGKEALAAAIKGSDLFVLNTSYEGLSHQLLEVMDLGVPIITTDIGGNAELITNGVSGLLVPINDNEELRKAIMHVLTDENLKTQLVQHAHVRTLEFSQDVVVERLAELLHQVVTKDIK
jgi:glycosyltransferase involved in cell wall biosynthesis